MGVQLPRSPVRLSLFRCSSLFVLLYGFFVSLYVSLCSVVRLSRLIGLVLFLTRVPYIYYLFSIWEINPVDSFPWFRGKNLFHTQRPFSVLTRLAFGDEKYYICTEIWEEPRLPPFFVTFPLKTGILGAHLGKICLPLILICLPQIFLSLPLSKTKRRVGKIRRR